MRAIHVLQHVAMEGPARIGDIARDVGLEVIVHPLYERAPVPTAIAPGDALVVMGGSMGVGDIGDARWPFLAPEADLVASTLHSGTPVLGICLGAQLMAHALGAHVYPCTVGDPPQHHKEVGWGAVTFLASAADEPALEGLHPSETVLHWHGDTFDLPEGAAHLASTLACPNQMFRFGRHSYAIQFHVEIEGREVERWVREDADFVRAANGATGGARILADTDRFMAHHRKIGDRLIANILRGWVTSD
jgi:GMP synthase-like glutamine amidotransferase